MRSVALSLICLATTLVFAGEPHTGLSPDEAVKAMKLPDGFNVTLFAGEPDVAQPVNFEFDDRGRLWVAEFLSYPKWAPTGHDRITIFEDTDGDGKFDKKKVFWDKGNYLSGIQLGFGGVYVCCAPNLLFIPDRDGDDVPDGEPEILLDGWSTKGVHNVLCALTWGPDGWLYGGNGITSPSKVGKPGTPDAQRVDINCGIWRYHPVRKEFEVVAHGTTNPWGIDFDEYGELFFTNNVIGHLWHAVYGMHFKRMFGQDFNPYAYDLIDQTADHIHWAGGNWTTSRGGKDKHNDTGGGHSHCGAMIYLGDNFPEQYHGTIFMCNTHGNRINNDILERKDSGYTARHGKDFMLANDASFRGTCIKYGPDGAVYVADWHQDGECHTGNEVGSGRIFKISYGTPKQFTGDISKLEMRQLTSLLAHKNQWFVRHARRRIQELSINTIVGYPIENVLQDEFSTRSNSYLEAVLTQLASGRLHGSFPPDLNSKHVNENIRCAIVDFLSDGKMLAELRASEDAPPALKKFPPRGSQYFKNCTSEAIHARFTEMAAKDDSALVRLHLASALQRLPHDQRWSILDNLAAHSEDAGDRAIPLMLWYAAEPLVPKDPARALRLAEKSGIPILRQYIARRLTDEHLTEVLKLVQTPQNQLDVLRGISEALKGRKIAAPVAWYEISEKLALSLSPDVRKLTQSLCVTFGEQKAIEQLRTVLLDKNATPEVRSAALASMLEAKLPHLASTLVELLNEPLLRGTAVRGLANYSDPRTPEILLKQFATLIAEEKSAAVNTLASRTEYANALAKALKDGVIAKTDFNAFSASLMRNLNNPEIDEWLKTNWGVAKKTEKDKINEIAKLKSLIEKSEGIEPSAMRGRIVFKKTCAQCHILFNDGTKVGPDLTGSGRANLDYLLQNIVDPNALVGQEYLARLIKTKDGRLITGLVTNENAQTAAIATATETLTIAKDDIVSTKVSDASMMPEGLLNALTPTEIFDLFKYLRSPEQVDLPADKK